MLRWLPGLLLWITVALHGQVTESREFKLGLLIPYSKCQRVYTFPYYCGDNYASAISVAVDKINSDSSLLVGHNLTFIWDDTSCEELIAVKKQIEQMRAGVDAFIGPACKCETAATNAAAYDLSMISYGCTPTKLSDKTLYPTFARTIGVEESVTPTILSVLRKFNWNRVAIVYENKVQYESLKEDLKINFKKHGIAFPVVVQAPDFTKSTDSDFDSLLSEIRADARIVVFATDYFLARRVVVLAKEAGMTNGDYCYILYLNDENLAKEFDSRKFLYFYDFKSIYNNDKDAQRKAKSAMDSVLLLRIKTPLGSQYKNFTAELKRRIAGPPFNSSQYLGVHAGIVPPSQAAYLYNAVYQYAVALNKSLAAGKGWSGTAIFNQLKNTVYMSIQGYQVRLDENGSVVNNYTLFDFVNTPDDNRGVVAVGSFQLETVNGTNNSTEKLPPKLLLNNQTITWAGGWSDPPKDTPKCGFHGELCPKEGIDQNTKIIAGVSGALVVLTLLLLANIIRQYRLERELKSRLWKIDYNQISFDRRRNSNTSLASHCPKEDHDDATAPLLGDEDASKFTTIAHFKGNLVTVAKLAIRHIDLTRKVLLELKQMRDIRHDNVNLFIGACTDSPNICIVMQYCSRGSLQDILENPDVKLDHMFIASLVADIVKGMAYIHGTDVKSHGNLKSSNCLVDSRWVLKITDYGLPTFRSKAVKTNQEEYAYYRDLLWVAPEILRLPIRPARGTQKGDVYSFAIILQEFHTREGPYSANFMEPKDITQRVKQSEFPHFRPTVTNLIGGVEEIRELMKHCWEENPDDRPEFHEIKKTMHKVLINNGMKTNIFDNMVYMMERYADNLEELVMDRTGRLIEEQKKTEALLERMLPRSVAEQLKRGKAVEAESFHEVSIYFSDIVGFTSLSAESTPMQVVTMLNDLYSLFDDIIREYDVYKVETIGDAYMVVSGLPIRNGHKHAGEVARMALHLVDAVKTEFIVRHKPGYKLKLRVGIHSGPVVAGVVGNMMPRYCLFGDTVNTASRMESNGEPLRVHISTQTKEILMSLGGFNVEMRGEIEMKGKGKVVTYWLVGSTKRRSSVLKQPRGLPSNGSTVPLIDYLAPGLKNSNSNLAIKRTDSGRRSGKAGPSPNMLRKWHRFDDDGVHHDGHIHNPHHPGESPRLHGRESPHHHIHHHDQRGSKELHGIHAHQGLDTHNEHHELSSDDQDNLPDGPSALPSVHFENENNAFRHTSV